MSGCWPARCGVLLTRSERAKYYWLWQITQMTMVQSASPSVASLCLGKRTYRSVSGAPRTQGAFKSKASLKPQVQFGKPAGGAISTEQIGQIT